MPWTRGLSKWTGQVSIIGRTADSELKAAERRKLRPGIHRISPYAASIFVASTDGEFGQAENLVRSAYASLGYDTKFLALQSKDQCNRPSRLTLLANLNQQHAGTFTVFLDGPGGVQADLAYPEVIGAFRDAGDTIIELGQFATVPLDNFQAAQTVFSALHNGVYLICASLKQAALRIVFEVNPHHVKYWRSLGWRMIGPPRLCDRVKAPGVLMTMEFSDYTQTMLQCWPLHARTQNITHKAWHRVIRYSMLWEDVAGVLKRINSIHPANAEVAQYSPSPDMTITPGLAGMIPTDQPLPFQAGSHHG